VLAVVEVEGVLDFEDVGLVESGSLVGAGVELGLEGLLLRLLVCSAHLEYNGRSGRAAIKFNHSYSKAASECRLAIFEN
jgi:hypothetical protein